MKPRSKATYRLATVLLLGLLSVGLAGCVRQHGSRETDDYEIVPLTSTPTMLPPTESLMPSGQPAAEVTPGIGGGAEKAPVETFVIEPSQEAIPEDMLQEVA